VLTQQLADKVGEAIEKFTITKTNAELYEKGAFEKKMLVAPVASAKDISEDIQLKARHYWTEIYHPELGKNIPYGGAFISLSENPLFNRMRAPTIGEHNKEIYTAELGMSEIDLQAMQKKGII
jgi:crotonobetainyl-CoA:carnitine CoA-transferase CaiB-like acyl-CoA transferase